MDDFITYSLKFIGGVSVLVIAAGVLSKILIKQLLQKDLLKFKSDLEKENQIQLVDFKSKTEILFHEYKENIKNLSEERLKAVKEIHNKFINAYAAYCQMITVMRHVTQIPIHEQIKNDANRCVQSLNDLLKCTTLNEIYLPTKLSEKIFKWRKDKAITCEAYGPIICDCVEEVRNKELLRLWNEKEKEEIKFDEIRIELKKVIGVEN